MIISHCSESRQSHWQGHLVSCRSIWVRKPVYGCYQPSVDGPSDWLFHIIHKNGISESRNRDSITTKGHSMICEVWIVPQNRCIVFKSRTQFGGPNVTLWPSYRRPIFNVDSTKQTGFASPVLLCAHAVPIQLWYHATRSAIIWKITEFNHLRQNASWMTRYGFALPPSRHILSHTKAAKSIAVHIQLIFKLLRESLANDVLTHEKWIHLCMFKFP